MISEMKILKKKTLTFVNQTSPRDGHQEITNDSQTVSLIGRYNCGSNENPTFSVLVEKIVGRNVEIIGVISSYILLSFVRHVSSKYTFFTSVEKLEFFGTQQKKPFVY